MVTALVAVLLFLLLARLLLEIPSQRNLAWTFFRSHKNHLSKSLRLPRGGQDRAPPTARRIKSFGMGCEEFDGDVDETLVQKADHDASLAGHCRMDGVA